VHFGERASPPDVPSDIPFASADQVANLPALDRTESRYQEELGAGASKNAALEDRNRGSIQVPAWLHTASSSIELSDVVEEASSATSMQEPSWLREPELLLHENGSSSRLNAVTGDEEPDWLAHAQQQMARRARRSLVAIGLILHDEACGGSLADDADAGVPVASNPVFSRRTLIPLASVALLALGMMALQLTVVSAPSDAPTTHQFGWPRKWAPPEITAPIPPAGSSRPALSFSVTTRGRTSAVCLAAGIVLIPVVPSSLAGWWASGWLLSALWGASGHSAISDKYLLRWTGRMAQRMAKLGSSARRCARRRFTMKAERHMASSGATPDESRRTVHQCRIEAK